jgi:acyl carrier protein
MANYMNHNDILQLILEHIESNRKILGLSEEVIVDKATILYGDKGLLDSLQLVHFLVTLEKLITKKLSKDVVLASPRFFSSSNSPARSPDSIAQFIYEGFSI